MGARNRAGIGLSYRPARARICKCLWRPGIDSEESISPAYVAWRAGTTNRVDLSMFLYIRQHHLFASYSLQHIFTNSHANIHFIILANICFKIFVLKRIFASKYSLSIASNYIGKAFTSLMTQLIFIFLKIFASYCLKIFALK
jgi:hypothetical protein